MVRYIYKENGRYYEELVDFIGRPIFRIEISEEEYANAHNNEEVKNGQKQND